MATLHRSLSMIRRMHGTYKLVTLKSQSPSSLLKPQYIAIRGYFNPDGDHMELSETAWKEKRLYRYYKFSNQLSVTEQGRGYAAGIFTIAMFTVAYFALGWIDVETCAQYSRYRKWRREERNPWWKKSRQEGYWKPWNYAYAELQKVFNDELPELKKKGHDAKNRREWNKKMCLNEVYKRDKEFNSAALFGPFDYDLPPKAHPAYQAFEEKGEYYGIQS